MVAFLTGPDPSFNVLVLDSHSYSASGYRIYDLSDLDTVGGFYLLHAAYCHMFDAVVIGDFNMSGNPVRDSNLESSLMIMRADNVTFIVDSGYENSSIARTITSGTDNVIITEDVQHAVRIISRKSGKHRIMNNPSIHIISAFVLAVSSFVLVGLLSFIIMRESLEGSASIALPVGLIVITAALIMFTSRLFGMPIISHARDNLTATSMIPGLGGGNLVRMVMALTAGIIILQRCRDKIELRIVAFTGTALAAFIIWLKIAFNINFSVLLLVLMCGEGSAAYTPIPPLIMKVLYLSKFIQIIGLETGYGIRVSRGMVMAIASAVLMNLLVRMNIKIRSTLILPVILLFARGITRIGDFDPVSLLSSVIPGILLGLILAYGIMGLERLVSHLTYQIKKRR